MTESCPGCAAPLRFDPNLQVLVCRRCGGEYFPEDLAEAAGDVSWDNPGGITVDNLIALDEQKADAPTEDNYVEEYMDCMIYVCSQCGAEIVVNDTEASTICIYCGCPSIVMSRIEKTIKPKYIIPFSVSKDEAEKLVRERITGGSFVPKKLKDELTTDCIRGIYVPYWLTNLDYNGVVDVAIDRMESDGKYNRRKVTDHKTVAGDCKFRNLTTDASYTLVNDFMDSLEPFNIRRLKPFDPAYLAGFYSDIADINRKGGKEEALEKAEKLFMETVKRRTQNPINPPVLSVPVGTYEVYDTEPIMCPCWFYTFRYNDVPHTIMVNGSTGKVAGAVPYNRKKYVLMTLGLALITYVIFAFLWTIVFDMVVKSASSEAFIAAGLLLALSLSVLAAGLAKRKKVIKKIKMTESRTLFSFVKKRQDGM